MKSDGIILKDEGDIPKKAVEGPSGHGSPTLGGESEARSRSEFDSLGQIHVFLRDVPESLRGDPKRICNINNAKIY